MREKPPESPSPDKKPAKVRTRNTLAFFGGTLALSLVMHETGHAVSIASRIENPTANDVFKILHEENQEDIRRIAKLDSCPSPSKPENIDILYRSIIQQTKSPKEIARRHNLELVDMKDLYDSFPSIKQATTPEQVTDLINEFSRPHMNLTIHADHFYENSNLKLEEYKDRIWWFMMIMREIPITILDKLEITDIHINAEDSIPGEYVPKTKSVSLNINYLDSPSIILHEIIGHGAHFTSCDGYPFNDHGMTSYNPTDFKYANDEWRNASPDPHTHISHYSTKNVAEDNAETTANYLTGRIDANLTRAQSPLGKKVGLILDRLNTLAPGSAEYLSSRIVEFKMHEAFHRNRLERQAKEK